MQRAGARSPLASRRVHRRLRLDRARRPRRCASRRQRRCSCARASASASSPARICRTRRSSSACRSRPASAGDAQYDVVSVALDDFVSMALLQMTKHNKRRVAVHRRRRLCRRSRRRRPPELPGRQFAARRRPHRPRLERRRTRASPRAGSRRQTRMLRRQGVKIEVVGEIVSDLNRHLLAKLFALDRVAGDPRPRLPHRHGQRGPRRADDAHRSGQRPDPLARRSPEGELQAFRAAFTGALESFGFPPCPGDVMVRQSAVVEDDRRLSRRLSPLARHARRARAHERRDLLRRRGGRGRRRAACAEPSWS